jgi:hypothetical protein
MKKLRIVTAVACLALPACYDFDFPLDPKPQVKVDARLLGTWRCLGAEADLDDAPLVLRVERGGEWTTHWSTRSQSPDDKDSGEYDVHASTLKGGNLLNALEIKSGEPGKWSFVRYTFLLPHVLRIQLVDEDAFTETAKSNAGALRKELERRGNDPKVYKDFCLCVRVKAPPPPSATHG